MKDFKIYLSIGCALVVLYLVAQYNKPNPVNWQTTLSYRDKIPFGTYILYHQLHDIFPEAEIRHAEKSMYRSFAEDSIANGNYVVVANTIDINKIDYKALAGFVEKGNTVFLSALVWKGKLADTLKLETGVEFTKTTALNFTNPQLKKPGNFHFKPDISNQYFKEFDTAKVVVLGRNDNGHANYLQLRQGNGSILLFANPQLLSNYNLLDEQGNDYAAKALSYLPVTKNLYWDLYQNGEVDTDVSPLRVFFANASLRWAYYLSLAAFLIFIIYEIKRRQRIIPVAEPLTNSTLEFVNVVGRVYFEQRNNVNIAHKKVLYLLEHIRTRYGLKTTSFNKEFTEALALKTGISINNITELTNHLGYISVQRKVTDQELIKLNRLIEDFYHQSS